MKISGTDIRRENEAFTLVEILVVLAILALTAAIVAPRFTRSGQDASMVVAVEAKQMLQLARLKAISTGKETHVVIDLDQRRLTTVDTTKIVTIPDGVQASATVGRDNETTTTSGAIHFYPDGSSSGGLLRFAIKGKTPSIVKVNWLTGSITGTHSES